MALEGKEFGRKTGPAGASFGSPFGLASRPA